MAQQVIGVGAAPNDGTGDTLRAAGIKINAMMAELYGVIGQAQDWLYMTEHSRIWDDTDSGTGYAGQIGEVFAGTGSATAAYAGDADTPQGREHRTSATLNNTYTIDSTNLNYYFLKHRLKCMIMGRLFSTNNGHRVFIGFTTDTAAGFAGTNTDNPATKSFAMFRLSAGVGGNWYAGTGNGAATTFVDTGVAASTTTAQTFRIEWDRNGAEVRFYINTALVATILTTLPASAATMRFYASIANTNGGDGQVRSLLMNCVKIREGIVTPPVT